MTMVKAPLLRVLVIDDSPLDTELIIHSLRKDFDPHFRRVDTAEEMLDALSNEPWDIIISDYVMPRFSGIDAITLLRERGFTLPLIVVSGKIGEDAAVETMRAGANDHIIKDNLARLVPAILRELKESELRRQKKRAEEELRRSELEHRQAMDQLRQAQKMEAIGQLAGGIAHDFNNLLTIINGYSTLILQEMPGDAPFRAEVEHILQAGERAADLTNQLLAFSRRQILEPKVININRLVRNVERMLKRLIRENIVLQTRLSDRLGVVKADPGQLEQIIMNLVVNARDALENGGTITIETSDAELDNKFVSENRGAVEGSYVMLAVHDNGVGMTTEVTRKIFEPFFTTKGQGKGTGLGLATVYGIVKQSGGYIQVVSELSKGSSFRVFLPRTDTDAGQTEVEAREKGPDGTETILVVEDEEGVLNLAVLTLRQRGYEVFHAKSPTEASEIFRLNHHRINLVLSDVIMPEKSGPVLAQEFRETRPDLKIMFMSGYTDDTILHQNITDEQTSFINKPFTPDMLAGRVRDLLENRINT